MTVAVDLTFPHRFECGVLDEIPGGGLSRHYFPTDLGSGQDGVTLRVRPQDAEPWIGTFAFGKFGKGGVTRVLSMPDPQKLCVVAKGAGYIVMATKPDAWEAVNAIPIVDVRALSSAGLVVFANYTELLAYGAEGVKWRTKRLAWDGLKIVSVGDRTIVGEYWDMREEATMRFEVDVTTGEARGGVEALP